MKKRILMLWAAVCLFTVGQIWAQTDVTSTYVKNYNFANGGNNWVVNKENVQNCLAANNCWEFWNGSVGSTSFDIHQDITALPNGVYRLEMGGFNRANKDYSDVYVYANTTDREFAVSMKTLASGTSAYGSTPNSTGTAKTALYNSSVWTNTVDNIIVKDGKLTIGARNVSQLNGGDTWTIIGNVKLFKLEGAALAGLMSTTIAEAQTWAAKGYQGVDALNAAIATAQGIANASLTYEAIMALTNAVDAYKVGSLNTDDATENTPVDATFMVKNAGFEYGSTLKVLSANGGYNEPHGWTLSYGSTHTNNHIGVVNGTTAIEGYGAFVAPTEGNYVLGARMRWTSGSNQTMTQTITSLPAGNYTLSADMGFNETGSCSLKGVVNGTEVFKFSPKGTSLTTYSSSSFTVKGGETLVLTYELKQSGTSNTYASMDNIKLTYYGASLELLTPLFNEAYASLSGLDMTKELLAVYKNKVQTALDTYQTTPTTANAMQKAITEMGVLVSDYNNQLELPAKVAEALSALVQPKADYNNSECEVESAKTTFGTILTNAENQIQNAGSLADITSALATVESARQAYVKVAQPTNSHKFDVTFLLNNADFEQGTSGWSGDFIVNTGGDKYSDYYFSGTFLEKWVGQWVKDTGELVDGTYRLNDYQAYQLVNVPQAGEYTLNAYAFGSQEGNASVEVTGIYLFANDMQTTVFTESGKPQPFSVTANVTNGQLTVGMKSVSTNGNWMGMDNLTLYYGGVSMEKLIPAFNETYAQLSALDLTKVLDAYKTQVQNTLNTYQTTPSTARAMEAAINEMLALINDYNNQVELWRQAENVAAYNRMKTNYAYSYASLLNPDISKDGWTNSDFDVMTADEHWNGKTDQDYYEQTTKEWGENSWEHHADETVTLPEGKYIMTVTARASASVTSSMSVKVGDAEPQVIMLPNKGSVGYGIDVNGTATFSEVATYANNDAGYGWEYCFIEFEVAAGGQDVTIAFDASANAVHQWVSIANPMLYGSVHPNQVVILQINNLATTLRGYESKPMDKALYADFASDLAAADAATVDSENLDEIVAALQADIATAKASVDAYAAYKSTYDFYVEKVGQMNAAGQTYWNENVGEAYAGYTNGTITDVVVAQTELKEIFNAALLAQGPGADLTLMITNPNYDNGSEGWPVNHSSTDGHSITYNGMFSYSVTGRFHHTDVYQENISLPAGTYCVSAKVNAPNPLHETSVFVYATTGKVNHWGDLFPGYVKCAYYDINQKETDQVLEAYFTLSEKALVRIGALTWGANVNGDGRGNFTVDEWTLRSVSSLVEGTTHKKFYGNFTPATVQAEVSAEVQVLDLTTASGLSDITLNVTNPNMLIYANAGQVASSQNNVIVNGTCASLSVADGAPFYVPTAFTATTATYTMNAVATEGTTSMGTLCLPFKVTSMPGKAYELVEEVAMGDVIYATPVTEIEANQPVLVSAKGAYTGSGEVAATQGGTYTNGYLVGTYTDLDAPQGSYVLQKHDNNVAFYLVGDVQPTVKPFRAYIKGTETSNLVKSIAIDFGFDATGIEGIEAAEGAVEVARYNAAGVQIAAPQKGVNFVRMSDGSVLKVMVK